MVRTNSPEMLRRWRRRARRAAALPVGVAAMLLAGAELPLAHAQPAASAAAPEIVPPRLESAPDVPYPEKGVGDAEVVLRLVIERDGRVRSVEVESGAEPFASAAKQGAASFRFAPGTRNGEPVVARIRFALTFREPEPVEEPPPDTAPQGQATGAAPGKQPGTPGAAPKPAELEPIEVVVRAERPPPSMQTMTRAEVRQLPGAFGDPFRAIEVLPGVTPIVSGLPYFYVRGAPPGNVGYYLDGVRVPYLFHVAAGPSVIHPGLVERVDLYSGGYPSRFGRYSGAIVAAETTPPSPDTHGEGNLRIYDAGALVESTFADGRGTALASGRYSYTAAVISLVVPELTLDYRDYQARVTYAVTPRDRLTLFAFGAYDLLAEEEDGIETILFGSEFYRFDGRYDVSLADEGRLRWAATWGFDQTRLPDQRNARDMLWGARVELTQPVGNATLRGGLDVMFDDYEADASYGDPEEPGVEAYNRLFPSRADSVAGAWADAVWRPDPRIEITPGVRLDLYQSNGASAVGVEPRLGVHVDVTKRLRILHALGLAHQPPSFVVPMPGLAVADLRGGLQRSLQTAAGVEVELPAKVTATVTLFNNIFLNMSDTVGVQSLNDDVNRVRRSLGMSRGLEVYIRRNLTQHLGGFLSYTLSRSTRTVGKYTFPYAFDRTHVLNAALSYDLGRGWRAGSRFTFYTGVPDRETPMGVPIVPKLLHPDRQPGFWRIDARVEKKWTYGETTWLSFVAEVLNTTLNKEIVGGEPIGPVSLPSIGLEGGF